MSKEKEKVFLWEELTEQQQQVIVKVHADQISASRETMLRIFNLGRPTIVIGSTYCRVHQDSAEAMILLTKNHL